MFRMTKSSDFKRCCSRFSIYDHSHDKKMLVSKSDVNSLNNRKRQGGVDFYCRPLVCYVVPLFGRTYCNFCLADCDGTFLRNADIFLIILCFDGTNSGGKQFSSVFIR